MTSSIEGLPLFVYGSLQPGELAHRSIAELLEITQPAILDDYGLWVRDGLPFAARSPGERVLGHLLWPAPDRAAELYERVRSYEGNKLYQEVTVEVHARSELVTARVFAGRRVLQGHAEAVLQGVWSLSSDPLLTLGMDAILRAARTIPMGAGGDAPGVVETPEFWDRFVPLQGLYLVLCSVLERYTALRFGPALDPMRRITLLDGASDASAAARAVDPPAMEVSDTRNLERTSIEHKPFETWYQVRNNLTHRGKGGFHDWVVVHDALVGLHDALRMLIASELPASSRGAFGSGEMMLSAPEF